MASAVRSRLGRRDRGTALQLSNRVEELHADAEAAGPLRLGDAAEQLVRSWLLPVFARAVLPRARPRERLLGRRDVRCRSRGPAVLPRRRSRAGPGTRATLDQRA